jgi:hypothetical protein
MRFVRGYQASDLGVEGTSDGLENVLVAPSPGVDEKVRSDGE